MKFSFKNSTSGSMTIRDADGNLHKSLQVESGSTRTSYIFENFVLKFEGLKQAGFPGQNEADAKAYAGVKDSNKQYFTRLLTENRAIELKVGGSMRKVQVIAAERATPFSGKLSQTAYDNLYSKYSEVIKNTGGRRIQDTRFPSFNTVTGHNTYIVKGRDGKASFKIFDYAFQHIKNRNSW